MTAGVLPTVAPALALTDRPVVTQAFKRLRKAGDAAAALQTPAPDAAEAQGGASVEPPLGTPGRDKALAAAAAVDPDEEGDEDDVSEPGDDAAAPVKAPAKGKAKKAASKKVVGSAAGVGEKSHAAAAEFTRCDPLKAAEGMWKARARFPCCTPLLSHCAC